MPATPAATSRTGLQPRSTGSTRSAIRRRTRRGRSPRTVRSCGPQLERRRSGSRSTGQSASSTTATGCTASSFRRMQAGSWRVGSGFPDVVTEASLTLPPPAEELTDDAEGAGYWAQALRRLLRDPSAVVGGILVIIAVLAALVGPPAYGR